MFDYLINSLMIPFLEFSYANIYPNYGVAIIVLTLIIKVIFYPLTQKQFQNMKEMQTIQPEIKKLQEKYKDNPKKQQEAMVKLWKEKKINPLSGCLPMLIQMPFFLAIFYTIKSDTFLQIIADPNVPTGLFSFWLNDLGNPDTSFILPTIIAVSTYLGQKLSSQDNAKQMAFLKFMPIIMFVLCIKMPSGVLLYWAISQMVSTAQQYFLLKKES